MEPGASLAEERPESSKGPGNQGISPPVDSSEAGNLTEASDEQPSKECAPSVPTDPGTSTERSDVWPDRAELAMPTTLEPPSSSGMESSVASPAYPVTSTPPEAC